MRSASKWASLSAQRRPRPWLFYHLRAQKKSSTLSHGELITLHPNSDLIEVVSTFEYLGSIMSDDCSLTAEVKAHISKASMQGFQLAK